MEEQLISIEDILLMLKKRWKMIVAITIMATITSAIISFKVLKPQYEVSTKVFIGKENVEGQAYNQSDVMMYQKLMKTYSQTIQTKDLVSNSLKDVKTSLTTTDILNNLTVVAADDTQILQIKLKGLNPNEIKTVIDSITNEFIELSKELVPNGNIKVIETSQVPTEPISPNKKMNIAIAFLLGLMVSCGICFLLEFLDDTFKNKDELERELEIPVIGSIPRFDEE